MARLHIFFFCNVGLFGSTIMGICAGVGCYNDHHVLGNAIILGIMLSVLMFFPIGFLVGFALTDEGVWHDSGWDKDKNEDKKAMRVVKNYLRKKKTANG